ncbi:hypothetical protein Zmor_006277 [Zophobas morio]|uniref:Uncharacterized protein n=1 Tax=Zophobas morio TaxID=2755281 RepID=A0AA38IX29_9CUCU|nr:hypothetical protein Zmor_006277 [Zophobas morio]
MSQEDFYNFSDLLKNVFVKKQKDSSGRRFLWHDCKWLKYTKQQGIIYYKKTLKKNDQFYEINFNRRGRPGAINLKQRYSDTVPIAEEKKQHLLELLPLVPVIYRRFYENLKTKAAADNDPDLETFDADNE